MFLSALLCLVSFLIQDDYSCNVYISYKSISLRIFKTTALLVLTQNSLFISHTVHNSELQLCPLFQGFLYIHYITMHNFSYGCTFIEFSRIRHYLDITEVNLNRKANLSYTPSSDDLLFRKKQRDIHIMSLCRTSRETNTCALLQSIFIPWAQQWFLMQNFHYQRVLLQNWYVNPFRSYSTIDFLYRIKALSNNSCQWVVLQNQGFQTRATIDFLCRINALSTTTASIDFLYRINPRFQTSDTIDFLCRINDFNQS